MQFYLTLILLWLFQQYRYNVTGQSQESEGSYKPASIKWRNSSGGRAAGLIYTCQARGKLLGTLFAIQSIKQYFNKTIFYFYGKSINISQIN